MEKLIESLLLSKGDISNFGILATATSISIALFSQGLKIFFKENGKSVNVRLNAYFVCLQIVVFLYGYITGHLSVMYSGFICFLGHLFVQIGLIKFKGIKLKDKVYSVIFIIFISPIFFIKNSQIEFLINFISITWLGIYYIFYSTFVIPFFIGQIRELEINKSKGVLEKWLLFSHLGASIFWILFGLTFSENALFITNSFSFGIVLRGIYLYYKSDH